MKLMTHKELVQRAAAWLRNSARIPSDYRPDCTMKVQCGVVFAEYVSSISETPDAIGWALCGRLSILIECKATRSDFLADRNKFVRDEKHAHFGIGQYRYYLTNPGIVKPHELPANWGLLEAVGRRVNMIVVAARQERETSRELSLLWSECRKIQIIKRGGKLLSTKHGKRVTEALERGA